MSYGWSRRVSSSVFRTVIAGLHPARVDHQRDLRTGSRARRRDELHVEADVVAKRPPAELDRGESLGEVAGDRASP